MREGWGLNVIEANAMGTPAIVYPVGGLVDSTLHDETGLVTRGETPESLADAILEIAQVAGKIRPLARQRLESRKKTSME